MPEGSINYEVYVPWLQGRGLNVYTQFGEDGLIATCLQRIGETNRQCFEIGAHDGRFFSNTLRLRELGWRAVLIESDERQFANLSADFGKDATCINVLCNDLDRLLLDVWIDETPDLGVIDIDGQDYWLWHDMWTIEPRVMLVEISTQGHGQPIPERGEPYPAQAGLDAITELGTSKGYTLVATTFCNALFVKTECL
jgi:hypothetical protein